MRCKRLSMPPPQRVYLKPHDLCWAVSFEQESSHICSALAGMRVFVYHIGSTAIPGILAKPIIDLLLEVDGLGVLDAKTRRL